MFGKLMPKEAKFFDLFNMHAELCVNAATELLELMKDSSDHFERRMHTIEEIEKQADDVARGVVNALKNVDKAQAAVKSFFISSPPCY